MFYGGPFDGMVQAIPGDGWTAELNVLVPARYSPDKKERHETYFYHRTPLTTYDEDGDKCIVFKLNRYIYEHTQ